MGDTASAAVITPLPICVTHHTRHKQQHREANDLGLVAA